MTRRIEPAFFFNMTQRIELFSIGLKDLMLFSLTQRIELFLTRTDRIGPFFLNMTGRIEFFLGFLHVYFFQTWCRELNPFFFEYDAKNWTLFFFECDVKNLDFSWIWRKELNPFSYLTQRSELLSDMNDSKNSIFQTKNTQWIELFEIWLKELNIWTMCQKKKDSENGTLSKWFFEMTHRIEPLFFEPFQDDSKSWSLFSIWLKELNPLFFS